MSGLECFTARCPLPAARCLLPAVFHSPSGCGAMGHDTIAASLYVKSRVTGTWCGGKSSLLFVPSAGMVGKDIFALW